MQRRRLHALVPALLALRHAAHLLGQAHVVRAHLGAQGRAAARERDDRLAPRAHQARPLRRLAREQRRLGALPRPLLGHADPGVALRRLRPRHVRRLGRRARRARRAATSPTSTCTGPYVDDVTIDCPKCERPARATRRAGARRVVRLRLDAGRAVPLPVRERRRCSSSRFPADFICEAIDQTRGWFYSLLAVNTLVFDRTPYRNVVCLALIVDQDGQKMSKSQGNVIDPWTVLETRGADALRWYFVLVGLAVDAEARARSRASTRRRAGSCSRSGTRTRSSSPTRTSTAGTPGPRPRRPSTARPRPLDPLAAARAPSPRSPTSLEAFDALRGAQALERFVDDLSNWYVRRSRPRFWNAVRRRPRTRRCTSASRTSRSCSRRSARSSPTSCTATSPAHDESVHLADWPDVDDAARSTTTLEAEMERARDGRVARARRRAPRPSSRCASRCARALVLAARRRARSPTRSRPRSPTSST